MSTPEATQPNFHIVPGSGQQELYEFPGRFADTWGAEQMTKNRIQATETGYETVTAASTVRTLGPGQTFAPYEEAKTSQTFDPQVVTSIRHTAVDPTYETGRGVPRYDNTFTVMPATTPATPHRTVPRPRIVGSQIALIAGPSGEEIFTDQFGRVKVWFPWDRRARKDGSDTCWMRVGQPWAGTTWGHQVIPRVGMECLISYQEGDPDRPFVTALVPDPTNPTPYPLPANKTRMVFRSNSYKSSGFNEMTFEDATGGENMFFHAQKDHTTRIENNQTSSVGASQSSVVGRNQSMTVGQNMTFEAGKSINFTIGGTGAGVAALMTPFINTGMAAETATMLSQGLSAASQASGEGGDLIQVLSGVSGALASSTTTLLPDLGDSMVGLLNQSGIQAQQNVWNGPSPRPDAGTALAAVGNVFGEAVGSLFDKPGMHNTITGTMRADHIGCARVEQVGTTKITNVGSTFGTKVGKTWSMVVGKDACTTVGNDWCLTARHDVSITAGHDLSAVVGHDVNVTAGHDIKQHAAHEVGLLSDDTVAIGARHTLTQQAETIDLEATDTIVLRAGKNTSLMLTKDGTITIQCKELNVMAESKILLIGDNSSVTIGPGKSVLSDPAPKEGGSGIDLAAQAASVLVKNFLKQKKVPDIIADAAAAIAYDVVHLRVPIYNAIKPQTLPDGSVAFPGGAVTHPDGTVDYPSAGD